MIEFVSTEAAKGIMSKQIPEFQAHLTDDSSHPGIIGRFAAIHTLPLIYPSEHHTAGGHNFIPTIVTIPCHTPSHTKSMIASQLFSIRKHVILPSPIAGLHTNYRSGLTLSTISSTHEVSTIRPPECTKGKMRAVNSCSRYNHIYKQRYYNIY